MLFTAISVFLGINLCIYLVFLVIFLKGISRKEVQENFEKKTVSVIVAARNEEKKLPNLLTGLVNQSYPLELMEIIVADDGSSDDTAGVIRVFAKKWPQIKLVEVQKNPRSRSAKKTALSQAIAVSTGEIILTTDADCRVGKYWIQSYVSLFKHDVSMIAGFSRTDVDFSSNSNLAQKYEHFDFNAMFVTAAAAINNGIYFSCSGQNLAYKKSAFLAVGGFENISHIESGDDVNLMQLFRKAGLKVIFNFFPESFVRTGAVNDWQELINQRSRWASNLKWQFILNPIFFFYLISVFVVTVFPLIIVFIKPVSVLIIIILRMLPEYIFLRKGFRRFGLGKKILNFYPCWFILQPVYILIVSFAGLFDIYRWKK